MDTSIIAVLDGDGPSFFDYLQWEHDQDPDFDEFCACTLLNQTVTHTGPH